LRGEDARELLESCGAARYFQPIPVKSALSAREKSELRRAEGLQRYTWEHPISDVTLRGLDALLTYIRDLEQSERKKRTALLWQALGDVEDRRGASIFWGEYTWGYSHQTTTATFDASFVHLLNKREWIPVPEGLERPEFVLFADLGWKSNAFLESKIRFKAPIIDQLATEVGIEPGVLELLKKIGLTSEAELRRRLGVKTESADKYKSGDAASTAKKPIGAAESGVATFLNVTHSNSVRENANGGETASDLGGAERGVDTERSKGSSEISGRHRAVGSGSRQFISYVAVHADEEQPDPDGLDHPSRMALEEKAIEFILRHEPKWRRTPTNNPGFDLYQGDALDGATHWCEVKAMTASLKDRPVGLSYTQFDYARQRGSAYWLYVVECATTDNPRLVRIQDPAGKAKTYTFDHGWIEVAALEDKQ
jgi:hypothetical protein